MRAVIHCAILFAAWVLPAACCCADPPEALSVPSLPHAFRISEDVLMGATPRGNDGFEALRRLGVRTVVSVDGAKPNLPLANEFKLRYVHLPLGYDGIHEKRRIELAKAIAELPSPIYFHCHKGLHRGPAAAAVACIGSGRMSAESGLGLLEIAGTGEQYRGLRDAVAESIPIEDLESVSVVFEEAVQTDPILESMVRIDASIERLFEIEKLGWKEPRPSGEYPPAHDALMVGEFFNELLRNEDTKPKPKEFRRILKRSRDHAYTLASELQKFGPADSKQLSALLSKLRDDCTRCHRDYRN